jgi:excisionase family DNA binding protein
MERMAADTPQPKITSPVLALSMAEAAKATGLSRSRLYLEVGAGRLRIKKAGRRTLVTLAELTRFLDSLDHAA